MNGEVPGQEGNNHPTNSPMGVFHTTDGLVNLAASTNKMFRAFTDAVGQPELATDKRFRSAKGRVEHRNMLWSIINDITSQMNTDDLVELANNAGCPCGPIYDVGEAFEDPQVKSLKMTRSTRREEIGTYDLVRSPINMSAFKQSDEFDRPGPILGEHTDEILLEMGFDEKEIASLRDAGAI